MASSVKYYRDDAALTILGNLTEQNSENTQTLADVSVRLSTLEDSSTSTISVMGSANSYAAGLVLAGDATHGSEFLRKDGTWQIPTDTNTIYSIMGASSRADGAGQYAAGLVLAGQSNGTRFLKEDGQWAAPGGGGGTTVSGTSLKSNNTNTNVNTTGGISLGSSTGNSGQGDYAVAIGYQAGKTSQGNYSLAIGYKTAEVSQGLNSLAIGSNACIQGQGTQSVAVGVYAKGGTNNGSNSGHGSTAVGYGAGYHNQDEGALAIGWDAGYTGQGESTVAVGKNAGHTNQGNYAVAVGENAGNSGQQNETVAIGRMAGMTGQVEHAVAIGLGAGRTSQGFLAVAIGRDAAYTGQGRAAIAIGFNAGNTNQANNTIILNASGSALNSDGTSRFYVKPVRGSGSESTNINNLLYNTSTGEISHQTISAGGGGGTTVSGTSLKSNNTGTNANTNGSVSLGSECGSSGQGAQCVAVGQEAGKTSQSTRAVAIGLYAAKTSQGEDGVSIGSNSYGTGPRSIHIGYESGHPANHPSGVAHDTEQITIGYQAGTLGNHQIIAIGNKCGRNVYTNAPTRFGWSATAVGQYAHAAGSNSIAIGSFCSASHTQSIVLGASAASQNTNSFNIPSGFSAYVGSSSWSTSDDRLKHNEALITNGLAVIRQIAPKCYQKSRSMFLTGDDGLDIVDASGNRTPYGADFNGIMEGPEGDKWFNDAGVIAQEMHTVLPNFVTVGDENRPWSVNYNALFSYSLSAVKELDAIVQELRDLNTALTARVAALES